MTTRRDALLWCVLAYTVASFFHYSHNAEFLADYPNLPAWLTRADVYAAWLGVTAVGVAGYGLVARGFETAGLVVLTIYGVMGLDGLGHYAVAPIAAHTLAMNTSIWLETAAAIAVLVAVARRAKQSLG